MKNPLALILALALLLGAPAAAHAQASGRGNDKLSTLIANLYRENLLLDAEIFDDVFPGASAFVLAPDRIERFLAPANSLNYLIATQLTSFPLGSAAGGFSWTFDPALGTFNRVTSSFGSSFVDRGLTIGRRRFNFGTNYQRATFDKIEGRDLRDGDIKVYAGVTCDDLRLDCDNAIFIEESLDLRLSTNTVGLFATYGVTDRLDLGIAVPIVSVDMKASLTSRVGLRTTDLED